MHYVLKHCSVINVEASDSSRVICLALIGCHECGVEIEPNSVTNSLSPLECMSSTCYYADFKSVMFSLVKTYCALAVSSYLSLHI